MFEEEPLPVRKMFIQKLFIHVCLDAPEFQQDSQANYLIFR